MNILLSMKPKSYGVRIFKGEGRRIKIAFPYNPLFVEKIKAIKGRFYK